MFLLLLLLAILPLRAQDKDVTLRDLVTPSTILHKDGKPVTFALNAFIEFESLDQLFSYIDTQAGRWQFSSAAERQNFGDGLLRRGIESRLVSMVYEKPLELLLTHTREELRRAASGVVLSFQGRRWQLRQTAYTEAFLRVQTRWRTSLNCWSAAPAISARVLSNWYPIEEGIELYGAAYDSTEHFWQAVKFHPDVKIGDLLVLLGRLEAADRASWIAKLDGDQKVYLANTYAMEFLRNNLTAEHLQWFRQQLNFAPDRRARELQQRGKQRFTALQEKILWGDLADVFHLLYHFNKMIPVGNDALVEALGIRHFDGIYLGSEKFAFISPQFQQLMLEIWKVKYLKMERFGDVIRAIPRSVKLDHFLNDGDSPDIPIPVYAGYLNQIREMAFSRATSSGKSGAF